MEKMMASLAIRVALINCSTLPKTNMLMIDEGFGALDETNLESCGMVVCVQVSGFVQVADDIEEVSHFNERERWFCIIKIPLSA